MAVIRIVQPPMVTKEMYDEVNARMDIDSTPPDGLIMHSAGEVDGSFQIVDVWESEEHARRFDAERLSSAVAAVAGPDAPSGSPPATVYELHKLMVP